MKDCIKQKLDKIDELFPKERIVNIKSKITSLYYDESFQIPVCLYPYKTPYYETPELWGDTDAWINLHLDACIVHGYIGDDFIPTIFPGCNIATIPSLFSSDYYIVDRDIVINPSINYPEEIANLEFSVKKNTIAETFLKMEEYIINETEGRINVNVIDSQGPMDAGGKIFNYEKMFELAYDDPELYHIFMNKVCDAFIFYWKEQKNILKDRFVNTHLYGWNWCPPIAGASMSCDSVVMVSPKFYEEFYKPYIEKIGKEFGGVTLHSCGYFEKVIPNLCNTKGFVGINAGQMTVKDMLNSGLDKKIVITPLIIDNDIEPNLKCIKENNLRVMLNVGSTELEKLYNQGKFTEIQDKIKKIKEYLSN